MDAAEFRMLRISVHSSFPLRQSKEEISCTPQDPTEQSRQHHVFGFRTIFVPSFIPLHLLEPAIVSLQGRPFLVGFLSFPWGKTRNYSFGCFGWVVGCFLLPPFLSKYFSVCHKFLFFNFYPKNYAYGNGHFEHIHAMIFCQSSCR